MGIMVSCSLKFLVCLDFFLFLSPLICLLGHLQPRPLCQSWAAECCFHIARSRTTDAGSAQSRSCISMLSSLSHQQPMQLLNSVRYSIRADDFSSVHWAKAFCSMSVPNYKNLKWNNNPLCYSADLLMPCCPESMLVSFWVFLLREKSSTATL